MSPCQSCGACCATLRITFPAAELAGAGGSVPDRLAESYGSVMCMRTTAEGRCIALRGTLGTEVRCAIYEWRPQACREFAPLAALGRGDAGCDEARRKMGLPSLDTA
jgi:uncharacterized protein